MRNLYILGLCTIILFGACSEDTGMLGIIEHEDLLTSSTQIFSATTTSVAMHHVISDNTNAYLGCVIDPETHDTITATCAAQFYCLEDYQMPPIELLKENENFDGKNIQKWCDSCEVRLYLKDVYGEKNNPMKLQVYLLDKNKDNMFNEDSTYYTDTDLMKFVPAGSKPIAERVFTSRDYMLSEADLLDNKHTDNIAIPLPDSIGQNIMNAYYENPDNFRNSYNFIHNVFPGLLFRISNGEGVMLTTQVGVINLFYDYTLPANRDTIVSGLTRFAATPEVIQSTSFNNSKLDELIAKDEFTYLKTPAGIATEMTLPIEEIFAGEHANDSVSLANMTLLRYNKEQTDNQLKSPSTILMIQKKDSTDFFTKHRVADGKTSFIANFNSASNTYYFSNIARLISYCYEEHKNAVEFDPDWNKVLLIPVTTTNNTSGSVTSVSNEMSLTSIRLQGGKNAKIPIQVVYTKYKK